jgi:hypothetical protein
VGPRPRLGHLLDTQADRRQPRQEATRNPLRLDTPRSSWRFTAHLGSGVAAHVARVLDAAYQSLEAWSPVERFGNKVRGGLTLYLSEISPYCSSGEENRRVSRRLALRRNEASVWSRSGYRMGTLRTELRPIRQLATTVRASPRQRGRAFFAELRPGAILVLAPGTLHSNLSSQVGGGRKSGTNLAPELDQGQ